MCPLYPLHLVLLYLCLLLPLLFAVVEGTEDIFVNWKLKFTPDSVQKLQEFNSTELQIECVNCTVPERFPHPLSLALVSEDPGVASVQYLEQEPADEVVISLKERDFDKASHWSLPFNLSAHFLGNTEIRAEIRAEVRRNVTRTVLSTKGHAHYVADGAAAAAVEGSKTRFCGDSLPVSVVRKKTVQSRIFTFLVAVIFPLVYINMGCAMDLGVVKATLRRPVGPLIGFVCQFLLMPLIAFAVGFAFPANHPFRLGLFVTGASPGGGGSNMWTLMFGGNLDLSLTMTTISSLAAFAMMPLWIFSLGRLVYSDDIVIPYSKILVTFGALIVPLAIGLLVTRYLPRVSKFLVRILKPLALCLLLFILVVGVWANLYIFKLMTWKVIVVGMALPWLGFAFGCTIARLLGRPVEDVTAIAIETGLQNTGISIFVLWFTFDYGPLGDMASVVPVAVAMMTPIPLLAALAIQKVRSLLGYQTKGRCPVAVTGEPVEMDMKDSESKQRLVRDPETNCAEAMGINDDLNNEKPIVKSANGCPMKGTT